MEASGEVEATLLHRSYLVRDLGVLVGLAGVALAFSHVDNRRFGEILALGIVGSTLFLLGARGVLHRSRAVVGPGGVRVGDKVIAARQTILGAWIEETSDVPIVHLCRGLRPYVHLEAADEAAARALCRALFSRSTYGLLRLDGVAGAAAVVGVFFAAQVFAFAVLRHPRSGLAESVLEAALIVLPASVALLRSKISIGTDGVLVSVRLRRRRFVAFRDIESVVVGASGSLTLTPRHGRAIAIGLRRVEAHVAAERIQAAVDACDAGGEPVGAQLRRDGPDVRAWLARLRTLAQHRDPYRAAGVTPDALWRLMDDPGAGESERAAAAVILAAGASGEDRSRLRGVAARVASPRVRVAIERVAEGAEEDDLAAAMAAVEDAPA